MSGQLPSTWRWSLDSRVVFIAKKGSHVPRPLRVGELWRRIFGKWILQRNLGRVRRAMLDSAQYAVAIPGSTDILIHARRAFREAVTSDPSMGVWVEVDVDFANAFPSLEHDSIDEAMQRLVPGVAPWCSWSHAEASTV